MSPPDHRRERRRAAAGWHTLAALMAAAAAISGAAHPVRAADEATASPEIHLHPAAGAITIDGDLSDPGWQGPRLAANRAPRWPGLLVDSRPAATRVCAGTLHGGFGEAVMMDMRQLGSSGPRVSALGLGCMGMTDLYGPADEAESIATIHGALDAGVTLLDTGDFYGMGSNELLIREALKGRQRERVVISVKFGALRDPAGGWLGYDGRPAAVKNFLAYSLRRLGTDYIDVYRLSRVDPEVPIEETVGAIAEMIAAGYVRHIGLSEAGAETVRRARAVQPIADLQIEYSLLSRGIEAEILPACRELGVGITAYGVLSRGLLGGHWSKDKALDKRDYRGYSPRFRGENLDRNLALTEALRGFAERKGVTVAQVAIAWVLSRGKDIVPLIGARRRDRLAEAVGALDVTLTSGDLAEIERAVPPGAAAGARYPEPLMAHLDSERRSSA